MFDTYCDDTIQETLFPCCQRGKKTFRGYALPCPDEPSVPSHTDEQEERAASCDTVS